MGFFSFALPVICPHIVSDQTPCYIRRRRKSVVSRTLSFTSVPLQQPTCTTIPLSDHLPSPLLSFTAGKWHWDITASLNPLPLDKTLHQSFHFWKHFYHSCVVNVVQSNQLHSLTLHSLIFCFTFCCYKFHMFWINLASPSVWFYLQAHVKNLVIMMMGYFTCFSSPEPIFLIHFLISGQFLFIFL